MIFTERCVCACMCVWKKERENECKKTTYNDFYRETCMCVCKDNLQWFNVHSVNCPEIELLVQS